MSIRVDLGAGAGRNWSDLWDFLTQTGQQTGNNELQNYEPRQVMIEGNGELKIVLNKVSGNRYRSGKIRSKNAITEWAPEYGALEFEFVLPQNTMQNGNSPDIVPGLWPAFWMLPNAGRWPTGGEIDLVEMMQFRGQTSDAVAFSTLHFGPSAGVDAVYDGHWGLRMGSFSWNKNQQTQKVRFEWERTAVETGSPWRLTQWVNNRIAWTQLTTHTDRFNNFERGKNFVRASPRDFAAGAPGDPAKIFQRAFDEPERGLHFIINLAFGGTPWNYDRLVDLGLQQSVLRVVSFRVWDMTVTTTPSRAPYDSTITKNDTEEEEINP